jgi:hypothetical protein
MGRTTTSVTIVTSLWGKKQENRGSSPGKGNIFSSPKRADELLRLPSLILNGQHVVTGRSPHAYVNQRLQIQLELLIMSGMPLETR